MSFKFFANSFWKNSLRFYLLPFLLPLFLWGPFLYFPLVRSNFWVHPDIAETLYTGSKMLGGKKLYVDWLNVNPPAIYQISELSEKLASVFYLPSVIFYYSLFLILSFVGFLLLKKSLEDSPIPKTSIPFYLLGYIGCIVGVSFAGPYEFSQREHWFVICFIPYCLGRFGQLKEKRLLTIWCVLLGFIASMKPGFLLLVLTYELVLILLKRPWSWRIFVSILSGLVLPYLILGLQSGQSLKAFFTWAVPSYKYYYVGYQEEWSFLLITLKAYPLMIFMPFMFFGFLIYYRHEKNELSIIALLLVFVSFLNVIVQHKFWNHLFIPMFGICLFFLYGEIARIKNKFVYPLCLLPLCFWTFQGFKLSSLPSYYAEETSRFYSLMPSRKVLLLTENVTSLASAYFSRVNLIGPWVFLHTFSGVLSEPDQQIKKRELTKIRNDILTSLDKESPELILIDDGYSLNGVDLAPMLEKRLFLISIFKNRGYHLLSDESVDSCCFGTGRFFVYKK